MAGPAAGAVGRDGGAGLCALGVEAREGVNLLLLRSHTCTVRAEAAGPAQSINLPPPHPHAGAYGLDAIQPEWTGLSNRRLKEVGNDTLVATLFPGQGRVDNSHAR